MQQAVSRLNSYRACATLRVHAQVLLHNLATARKNAPAPQLLHFIPPEKVEAAYKQVCTSAADQR